MHHCFLSVRRHLENPALFLLTTSVVFALFCAVFTAVVTTFSA